MGALQKFRRIWLLAAAAVAASVLLFYSDKGVKSVENSSLEVRLREVLSCVDGAGEVQVLVNETADGDVIGVCVLTPAADDVATVFRLQRAVGTALGIENERIEVIRMEGAK